MSLAQKIIAIFASLINIIFQNYNEQYYIHTLVPLQTSDIFTICPQRILNIDAFKMSVLLHTFF